MSASAEKAKLDRERNPVANLTAHLRLSGHPDRILHDVADDGTEIFQECVSEAVLVPEGTQEAREIEEERQPQGQDLRGRKTLC